MSSGTTFVVLTLAFQNCNKKFSSQASLVLESPQIDSLALPILTIKPIPPLISAADYVVDFEVSGIQSEQINSILCTHNSRPAVDCRLLRSVKIEQLADSAMPPSAFGYSISASSTHIVVGSPAWSGRVPSSGGVFIYTPIF